MNNVAVVEKRTKCERVYELTSLIANDENQTVFTGVTQCDQCQYCFTRFRREQT